MKLVLDVKPKGGFVNEFDIVTAKKTIEKLLKSDLVEISISELPVIPEVEKVETGILMSPAELLNFDGFTLHFYDAARSSAYHINVGKRIKIDEFSFPKHWHKDILTEFNFNSIPVGSLIEVKRIGKKPIHGTFVFGDNKELSFGAYLLYPDNIEYIKIIAMPVKD